MYGLFARAYGNNNLPDSSNMCHETTSVALPESIGVPVPGIELKLVPSGSKLEVRVRGPHITPGYFRRPQQTAAAFADGWFRTGDLGVIDAAGRLQITGRATDVIHVAGFTVFPAEIEECLESNPAVAEERHRARRFP